MEFPSVDGQKITIEQSAMDGEEGAEVQAHSIHLVARLDNGYNSPLVLPY